MGDWHPGYELRWFGEGREANTLEYLGLYGIFEYAHFLRPGEFDGPICFIANHFRAILDMIYLLYSNSDSPNLTCLSEEFIDNIEERNEILEMAVVLSRKTGNRHILEFVKKECEYTYGFQDCVLPSFEEITKRAEKRFC